MLVLAIDTATAQAGVALGGPEGTIASFTLVHERRHVEALAPAIAFACDQAGIRLADVGLVAVDTGPGSFTGLRVGLAAGKAICHARGIPAIGMSSLDLLAHAARLTPRTIVAAVDALREEVYYATYITDRGRVTQTSAPQVTRPEMLAEQLRLDRFECLLVGDGARRYASIFATVDGCEVGGVDLQYPNPCTLAELALEKAGRGEAGPAAALDVMYLREPYIHPKRR